MSQLMAHSLKDEGWPDIPKITKEGFLYNETGTVPAVRIFAKEFGMDRRASKLYEVFESGPMKKIAKYGGLPKPTGCV